jgi:hypothetical protein
MAQRTAGKHPKPEGLQWAEGTIANCVWAGAKLRDVLLHAGVPLRPDAGQEDLHVRFASHVTPCEQDGWYGGSIPLDKVMDESEKGDVLLAYEVRYTCIHVSVHTRAGQLKYHCLNHEWVDERPSAPSGAGFPSEGRGAGLYGYVPSNVFKRLV